MADATVFVDDAVMGRLPYLCAKTGDPADGQVRFEVEVGSSNRIGILWLLLLVGPLGWLILLFLAFRDSGERLVVRIPFSDSAYGMFTSARRFRRVSTIGFVIGLTALFAAAADILPRPLGIGMALVFLAGGAIGVVVGEWQMRSASVGVQLDASRRWVTLRRVDVNFAEACDDQRSSKGGTSTPSAVQGEVNR